MNYFCNGVKDCSNEADEVNCNECDMEDECDINCSIRPRLCSFRSSSDSYNCPNDQILPGKLVCDGKVDCRKGRFDEISCLNKFDCRSSHTVTVEKEKVCDHINNCEDTSCCFKTRVYCCNRKSFYIRLQKVIDGIEDGQDGSDQCPHETFKKAIFFSEEVLITNKSLQVGVCTMELLVVCGNITVIINTFNCQKSTQKR